MKKYIFIILLLVANKLSFAQSASGNWSSNVPASTITEAGENYNSNWESLANQTIISLVWLRNYTVKVKRTDVSWNTNLSIWIRKTYDGISVLGTATPAGLSNYMQLLTTDQTLFTTSTGVGIPGLGSALFHVQYEIRGLSVTLPAQSYSTTITYTISSP